MIDRRNVVLEIFVSNNRKVKLFNKMTAHIRKDKFAIR